MNCDRTDTSGRLRQTICCLVLSSAVVAVQAAPPKPATRPAKAQQTAMPPIVQTQVLLPIKPEPAPSRTSTPRSTRVSNVWVDTELRQVLQDISSQTGTAVLADQTVQGILTLSVKDMEIEECLERVCAVGGYCFTKVKDYYVVGRSDVGTEMFRRVAEGERVKLQNVTADDAKAMLPESLARYVSYDKGSGAVLVHAPAPIRQKVIDALRLIDAPPEQIAVEAVVFELTEEGSKQLGLDWQHAKGNLAAAGQNLIGTVTYDAASDIATYVDVTLRAILQDLKGQVLANPRIVVQNGKKAEIFVGQEKYFSLLNGYAANPYFRLESIKAGVTLKVMPFIGDRGQVTLEIESEVSDVITDWTREPSDNGINPANGSLPLVTRRQAKTTVATRDGETILLGGLLQDQQRKIVEKVPLLGDVPLAGLAFRNVRSRKEQKEIVVLLTAHLMNRDAREALPASELLPAHYVSPLAPVLHHSFGESK